MKKLILAALLAMSMPVLATDVRITAERQIVWLRYSNAAPDKAPTVLTEAPAMKAGFTDYAVTVFRATRNIPMPNAEISPWNTTMFGVEVGK